MTNPRIWSGGAYTDREGIEVTATEEGLKISPWYDGGIPILWEEHEGVVTLTWAEIDAMREEIQ